MDTKTNKPETNGSVLSAKELLVTSETDAFERAIQPVARLVFPEKAQAILSLRPDPELQRRIEVLAGKSTEGCPTESERAEYAAYVRANKFIAILQRLARQMSGAST